MLRIEAHGRGLDPVRDNAVSVTRPSSKALSLRCHLLNLTQIKAGRMAADLSEPGFIAAGVCDIIARIACHAMRRNHKRQSFLVSALRENFKPVPCAAGGTIFSTMRKGHVVKDDI